MLAHELRPEQHRAQRPGQIREAHGLLSRVWAAMAGRDRVGHPHRIQLALVSRFATTYDVSAARTLGALPSVRRSGRQGRRAHSSATVVQADLCLNPSAAVPEFGSGHMVDPRVAELALEFIDRRVFDSDLDAWRTAKRLAREFDRIAGEDGDPRAREPMRPLDVGADCVRELRLGHRRRREGRLP